MVHNKRFHYSLRTKQVKFPGLPQLFRGATYKRCLIRLRLNKRQGKGHDFDFFNEKLTLMLEAYVDNIIRA